MAPDPLVRVRQTARKAVSALGERDAAIRDAYRAKVPMAVIAAAAGLTRQRVHQIVRDR
jgi:hypothetical protein